MIKIIYNKLTLIVSRALPHKMQYLNREEHHSKLKTYKIITKNHNTNHLAKDRQAMIDWLKLFALFLIIFHNCLKLTKPPTYFKLTNVICETADKNFIEFTTCKISKLKGSIFTFDMYAKLRANNIENVTVSKEKELNF